VHELLHLGLPDLPAQAGLVLGIVPGEHPPAGLVAHLPGAGRDGVGRGGDSLVCRVKERDDLDFFGIPKTGSLLDWRDNEKI